MEKTKKKDFVEIKFTGYTDGKVFDSNIEEDLIDLEEKAKAEKIVVAIGENMVVAGLDEALVGKEIGKEFEVTVNPVKGFGERKRDLVKTVPLSTFSENKINPKPGMVLSFEGGMIRVAAVSGARVVVDFNNPLAGKILKYKFKIIRKISEDKEKVESIFQNYARFIPDFEIKDDKVIVKGSKDLEPFIIGIENRFKEMIGKGIVFEVKKDEKKSEVMLEEKSVDNK